jgi:hypothetical protein
MEATCFSETSVNFYLVRRLYIPEDRTLQYKQFSIRAYSTGMSIAVMLLSLDFQFANSKILALLYIYRVGKQEPLIKNLIDMIPTVVE